MIHRIFLDVCLDHLVKNERLFTFLEKIQEYCLQYFQNLSKFIHMS